MADNQDPTHVINKIVNQLKTKKIFPVDDQLICSIKACSDSDVREIGTLLECLKSRDAEILKQLDILTSLLEYLQICIKYQEFDLEATRRERDEYLRMLGGEE